MSKDTLIAEWLDANAWSKYQSGFDALKLKTLGDIKDDTDAKFAIEKAAPDAPDDLVQTMLDSWKAQVASKDDKPAPPAPASAPRPLPADATIPAGLTFDLSAPTITFSNITYTVPQELVMATNTQPPAQGALTPAQWMMLASQTFLTRGLDLSLALSGKPCVAKRSALVWKSASPSFFTMPAGGATADSVVNFSSAYSALSSQKMVAADLKGTYAFCSAAAAAQYDQKRAEATASKRIYVNGWWRFPLAKVQIDKCTDLSPTFVGELTQALSLRDDDPARQLQSQYAALRAIFSEYGQAIAKLVTLGGEAWFSSMSIASALVSEESVSEVVKVAVNLSLPNASGQPPAGGAGSGNSAGGSATVALGDGRVLKAETFSQTIHWEMAGGGRLAIGNTPEWLTYLASPSSWEVILREEVTSILDFIQLKNPVLAASLQQVWTDARNATWTGQAPPGFDDPAFAGQQVFIKNAMAVIGAFNAGPASAILCADFGGLYVPFPPIVASQQLSDPGGNHLLWKFVYAGVYNHDTGEPLYRIQTSDGAWCMSTSWVTDNDSSANWMTLSLQDASKPMAGGSASDGTLWLLRDADPFHVLGPPFKDSWLLKNVATGLYLGDSALWDTNQVPGKDQQFRWRYCLHDLEAELGQRKPASKPGIAPYSPSQALIRACWTIHT